MSVNSSERASHQGGLSHIRPRVLVGVTGGIAAYKSAILVRRLREWGADVTVVPTHAALGMVGKTTWEALSGRPVYVDVPEDAHEVVHVRTGQEADLFVIAPATANTMAKIAAGIADNLLTASVLVATCPILIAPAMHTEMWMNPATQANAKLLHDRGLKLLGPDSGRLTGKDTGPGRMVEPDEIAAAAIKELEGLGFARAHEGKQRAGIISISAGGTREAIDPVRYIANRSSGRMGVALANAAARLGYDVRLAAANLDSSVAQLIDADVRVADVESALDLQEKMGAWAHDSDAIIMAAAVSDYRVASSETKVKRAGDTTLTLIENPDILKHLASHRPHERQIVVGFAAETGDTSKTYIDYGKEKAARKGADLIAINQVGQHAGFGDVETELTVVDKEGNVQGTYAGTKDEVARGLMELIDGQISHDNAGEPA